MIAEAAALANDNNSSSKNIAGTITTNCYYHNCYDYCYYGFWLSLQLWLELDGFRHHVPSKPWRAFTSATMSASKQLAPWEP